MAVLPYRVDGDALLRVLDHLARRRPLEALRLGAARKGVEGTLVAARALGLVDAGAERLTEAGRTLVLAAEAARAELLRTALRAYAPYGGVLSRVATGELGRETEADWVARWWATQGYGSSETNRVEGVAAFARLAEAAGLVRYVPGRRGHATRLRWTDAARGLPAEQPQLELHAAAEPAAPPRERTPDVSGQSQVTFVLGPGRVARLRLPPALTPGEKRRLLALVDLLVEVRG